MEQFSKIYLLQSEAVLLGLWLQIEVANQRFSKRLLKCEKIVMCCATAQHDLREIWQKLYKLYGYCA